MQSINNLKRTNKGAQGIGTLIIFIAMILVAAVAAGVLIQTASSLQSKSLDVGRQSQEKLTTDIEVVQVYSNNTADGQINSNVDDVIMVVRLGSGSSPIKLEDLLVRLDTQAGTQSLTYSGSISYNNSNYGIDYKISGSEHVDNYLSSGDLAEIKLRIGGTITGNVSESETATIRLISKNGAVKPIQVTTPSAMTSAITYLYP